MKTKVEWQDGHGTGDHTNASLDPEIMCPNLERHYCRDADAETLVLCSHDSKTISQKEPKSTLSREPRKKAEKVKRSYSARVPASQERTLGT